MSVVTVIKDISAMKVGFLKHGLSAFPMLKVKYVKIAT